jgi:hypothetical protein
MLQTRLTSSAISDRPFTMEDLNAEVPEDIHQYIDTDSTPVQAGTNKYATPEEEFLPIAAAIGGFDLDPCASHDSVLAAVNVRNNGGLRYPWGIHDTVFVNHPYDKYASKKWLKKAIECDAETVVALSRADMSADWFHEYALQADLICFPDNRIKFVGFENSPPFQSIYTVYGEYPAELRAHFESIGWVATGADGFNEIRTATPDTNPLIPDISRVNRVTIEFSDVITTDGINRQRIAFTPLVHKVSDQPTPDGRSGETNPGYSTDDIIDPYIQLTGIHEHDDGTDTWIVLAQQHNQPRNIHAYLLEDRQWANKPLERIQTDTDPKKHPPSSHMLVP